MYKGLRSREKKIAVVGLGYVGLPLFLSLGKHFDVIGFDTNEEKILNLKKGLDENNEVEKDDFESLDAILTGDPLLLKEAHFFIIAVPTPINSDKEPDLGMVKQATSLVAENMPEGSIVVYESTVYPGVTEDICVPLLEEKSGMKNLEDFFVGYSPERINPGDRVHTLEDIIKVVSAQTEGSLDVIDKVYSSIIKAGTFRASSIKVAEAAKVIENTQRDINVALINELAMIFSKVGIDTSDVLRAAGTKWNFLHFVPGLVGGHCIGVDPYYLTYLSKRTGHDPEVINAGRKINDTMGSFIGMQVMDALSGRRARDKKPRIVLFGITFKENVKDSRNSKVIDIYNYLTKKGAEVYICDPVANRREVGEHYGLSLIEYDDIHDIDAAVFCVAHDGFKKLDLAGLKARMREDNHYLFDVKWIFDREYAENLGYRYWRL